jgi:hypothetical protein
MYEIIKAESLCVVVCLPLFVERKIPKKPEANVSKL